MTDFSTPLSIPKLDISGQTTPMLWQALTALSTLSAAIFLSLMLWVWVTDDPHGGEPITTIKLNSTSVSDIDPAQIDVIGVRPSITPNAPRRQMSDTTPDPTRNQDQQPAAPETPVDATSLSRQPLIENDLRNRFDMAQNIAPVRLTVFPSENLVERTQAGLIPRRGSGSATAFRVYSRPVEFVPEGPKIALVVGDIGLSTMLTRSALQGLPTVTALAVSPYGHDLGETVRMARENGCNG